MIAVSVAAQLLQKVEERAAHGYNSAQHPQTA
jgi:xanthine dehydrogenase accessory factor